MASPPLDVYLFPAIVGGGLGDIEEVLLAGRILGRAGFSLYLYRDRGRSLPRDVAGPWQWPRVQKRRSPARRASRALTIAPMWGVSAAPARPGPLGRPGPWTRESDAIERAYGADHVVHVSLEEFARVLTGLEETRERFREGGVPARKISGRTARARAEGELLRFRAAYRSFRGFDRANVASIFATFLPSRRFAGEHPEAIQAGPLWPERSPSRSVRSLRRRREWVWYASPASSERIVGPLLRGLDRARPPILLRIRSPHRFALPQETRLRLDPHALSPACWQEEFRQAELRIVTGSRSLLEAILLGRPFLYFNGILGTGSSVRRHRPEKIRSLLAAWSADRVGSTVRRDLDLFSRGRSVERIVRRATTDRRWGAGYPTHWRPRSFRPPFDDAGHLLLDLARRWSVSEESSASFVASVRHDGRAALIEAAPSGV
ncbi:MAG: hypothetical protein L3J93_04640 [Thermoplasmata archaeon]|nr:hypothetical protein [Thermoplasmata archaeon]